MKNKKIIISIFIIFILFVLLGIFLSFHKTAKTFTSTDNTLEIKELTKSFYAYLELSEDDTNYILILSTHKEDIGESYFEIIPDEYGMIKNKVTGEFDLKNYPWTYENVTKPIIKVVIKDELILSRTAFLFDKLTNLQEIIGLDKINTKYTTDMTAMFNMCSSIEKIDLSSFDFDNVENMSGMFINCSSLSTIYVNKSFNISKLTDSNYMFYGCTNLVGGNGTVYDSNHLDSEYARIDSIYQPGYLTIKKNH